MKFADTHSHLYRKDFRNDIDAVLERSRENCSHVFLPNIDLDSIPEMLALTERDPGLFYPMMGLHPCDVKEDFEEVLGRMQHEFDKRIYFGVGETGLDYYWDKTFVAQQKTSLRIQAQWAKEMSLPLILHCRDSMDDVIELMREVQDGRLRGIFHCFTGDTRQAKEAIALGFMLGIGGVLTYKNSNLHETLKDIPLESLVLETDSPYLAPVPFRGKRNESAYIRFTAEKLAEVKGCAMEEIAKVTTANALRIFSL